MKWSILILTIAPRKHLLERLLDKLLPQTDGNSEIEVLVRQSDSGLSLGENRQALLESARGEYANFIDDDDLVADDYVSRIFPLLDGVDYVSFQVQLYTDGVKSKRFWYSLAYKREYFMDSEIRDISHLHPMRRELAMLARFEGGRCEDLRWANRLRALDAVKTEHNISEPLYFYLWRTEKEKHDSASS